MVRRSDIADPWTQDTIEDLFAHPPINEAELEKRLESVNKTMARRITVDRLHKGSLPDRAGPLFLAVMAALGVGHQKKRLTRLALDRKRAAKERLFAAMSVTVENPGTMDTLLDELGPEGMGVLAELSLFELLAMQDPDEVGEPIATTLENLMENQSIKATLDRIEAYRQGIGVSCGVAYRESLQRESLTSIRKDILDLVVEEASEDGAALLSALRDETNNENVRRDYQAALLRLRSDRIDPNRDRRPQKGTAHMSNCDGQGDFVVLGCFENLDDTMTVADLCIRADGELRDSSVYTRRSAQEVECIKERVVSQLGCYFVEIPLEVAAHIVVTAARRTHDQSKLVDEAKQAIALFQRVVDALDGEVKEEPVDVDVSFDLSKEAVRDLLGRCEYDDTWFFDSGDLRGIDTALVNSEQKKESWAGETLKGLCLKTISKRLVSMANHMANWHMWKGEHKEAFLCEAAAQSVIDDAESSPLAQVMLERSVMALRDAATELSCFFGDSSTRQRFKMMFFKDVVSPTGRDLARLDLVEATASALGAAFNLLPGERRPSDADRDKAAFELGKIFADHIVSEETVVPDYTVPLMSQSLANACKLDESERHKVIMTVVPSLYSFVEEVCSVCPVNCLKRPDDDVSDVFFRPHHPLAPERFGFGNGEQ